MPSPPPPQMPAAERAARDAQLQRLSALEGIFASAGEREAQAEVLERAALLEHDRGALGSAIRAQRRALELRWAAIDDRERGQGMLLLATLLLRADRLAAAARCTRTAEALARAAGDALGLAAICFVDGLIAAGAGDPRRAERLLHRAREGFIAAGRVALAAHALSELGELAAGAGQLEAASLCFEAARELYRLARSDEERVRASLRLGALAEAAGAAEPAALHYASAAAEAAAATLPDLAAEARLAEADAWLRAERPAESRAALAALSAEALRAQPAVAARILRRLAEVELAAGARAEGLRLLERAVPLALAAGDTAEPAELAELWVAALVDGRISPSGWPRITTLAEQLERAGHRRLAVLCREAIATLR